MQFNFDEKKVKKVEKLIKQNGEIDFQNFPMRKEEELESLNWKGITGKKDALQPLLLAYQRLLKILPIDARECALHLLKEKIHSALQIASRTEDEFLTLWKKCTNGKEEDGRITYRNAVKRRSKILLRYINNYQNNEPHIKQARF